MKIKWKYNFFFYSCLYLEAIPSVNISVAILAWTVLGINTNLRTHLLSCHQPYKHQMANMLNWWGQNRKLQSPRAICRHWQFPGWLTAEASCSSVMSSTNMGRTAGSSGSASAEPIISRVIPCNTRKIHEQTQQLPWPTFRRNPCCNCPNTSELLTFFSWMFPHSSSWNQDNELKKKWLLSIQHWDGAFVVDDGLRSTLRNWPMFCLANKSILMTAGVVENYCRGCFISSLLCILEFWSKHSDSKARRVRGDKDSEDIL